MKKLTSLLLSLALALGVSLPARAQTGDITSFFPANAPYRGFDDVKTYDWFSTPVRYCVETGLMEGTGAGFEPYKTLTVAEVAALTARVHAAITGETVTPSEAETPWYQGYLDHLEDLGLTLPDPAQAATRRDFVTLLAAVVPETFLPPINQITALPDTAEPAVLTFYNAGILTGVNDYGTFAGGRTLTRAECAAMVGRVIRPTQRQAFTPAEQGDAPDTLYLLDLSPEETFFTWCGLSVDAQTYLDVLEELYTNLVAEKAREGKPFSWDLTRNSGANEVPVLDYLEDWIPYYALQRAWNGENRAPFPVDEFNAFFVAFQAEEPAPSYVYPIQVKELCDGYARLHPTSQEVTP